MSDRATALAPETNLAPARGQFPKPCPCCGRVVRTAASWAALHHVGISEVAEDPTDPIHPEAYKLDHRNCQCGTTLSVVLARPGAAVGVC